MKLDHTTHVTSYITIWHGMTTLNGQPELCTGSGLSVPADCSEAESRLFHGQVKGSPIQNGLEVHKGSQPKGETRLKPLQSPLGSRVQTPMQLSPRIHGAQITANWGSQWTFWDPLSRICACKIPAPGSSVRSPCPTPVPFPSPFLQLQSSRPTGTGLERQRRKTSPPE